MTWLLAVAGFLWSRRRKSPFLFGEYMLLNGIGRATVELWRVNPRVALSMTEAQWIGLGLIAIGVVSWTWFARRSASSATA